MSNDEDQALITICLTESKNSSHKHGQEYGTNICV